MTALVFHGLRGGAGCSTLAAAVALVAAEGSSVPVSLVDASDGTMAATLGIPDHGTDEPAKVRDGLPLYRGCEDPTDTARMVDALACGGLVIVDAGRTPHPWHECAERVERWDVTTSTYLGLRSGLASPDGHRLAVVERSPGLALGTGDALEILGPHVWVPFDTATARAVDAGLLSSRLPRSLRRAASAALGLDRVEVVA